MSDQTRASATMSFYLTNYHYYYATNAIGIQFVYEYNQISRSVYADRLTTAAALVSISRSIYIYFCYCIHHRQCTSKNFPRKFSSMSSSMVAMQNTHSFCLRLSTLAVRHQFFAARKSDNQVEIRFERSDVSLP